MDKKEETAKDGRGGLGLYDLRRKLITLGSYLSRPERFFLVTFISFGVLFGALIPPMQVADESNHFFRAYQVSEGNFTPDRTKTSSGGSLPVGVKEFAVAANKEGLAFEPRERFHPRSQYTELWRINTSEARESVDFANTALYSPLNYVVPAMGIRMASLVTDKVIAQFYAARISNFLFLVACLYFAVKWFPRGKWALVIVLLMPMVLYVAVSISADVYLIGLTALFTALWFKLYGAASITPRQWVMLGALAAFVAATKQPYFMFVLVLPLLLKKVWGNREEVKRRALAIGAIGAISAFLAAGWLFVSRGLTADYVRWVNLDGVRVTPAAQQEFAFQQPLDFILVTFNSLVTTNGNEVIKSFFGNFGWLDTPLPLALGVVLAITVFLGFGLGKLPRTNQYMSFSRLETAILLLVGVLCVLMIAGSLYIYWTPQGDTVVYGFQGRYFIPLLIFLMPVLVGRYVHTINKRTVLGVFLAVLACCVAVLSFRYYNINPPFQERQQDGRQILKTQSDP